MGCGVGSPSAQLPGQAGGLGKGTAPACPAGPCGGWDRSQVPTGTPSPLSFLSQGWLAWWPPRLSPLRLPTGGSTAGAAKAEGSLIKSWEEAASWWHCLNVWIQPCLKLAPGPFCFMSHQTPFPSYS